MKGYFEIERERRISRALLENAAKLNRYELTADEIIDKVNNEMTLEYKKGKKK